MQVNEQRLNECIAEARNMGLTVGEEFSVGQVLDTLDINGYEDIADYWMGNLYEGCIPDDAPVYDDPFTIGEQITVTKDGRATDVAITEITKRNSFDEVHGVIGERINDGGQVYFELASLSTTVGYAYPVTTIANRDWVLSMDIIPDYFGAWIAQQMQDEREAPDECIPYEEANPECNVVDLQAYREGRQ